MSINLTWATRRQQVQTSDACSGRTGPDLTHLASRQRIASSFLPDRRAHLMAMPNLTGFTGVELDAITHFLEGLK